MELLRRGDASALPPDEWMRLATCGPILQEVFQGLQPGPWNDGFQQAFLALPCLSDPLPARTFQQAAEIYRLGRWKGYTIRSSTDCLIAAVAIEERVPVWHRDRDFAVIARFTGLQTIER
jgi:predicted nucleic acid-binding protein